MKGPLPLWARVEHEKKIYICVYLRNNTYIYIFICRHLAWAQAPLLTMLFVVAVCGHMCTHLGTYINIYIYIFIYVIYVFTYIYIYIYLYVYLYIYVDSERDVYCVSWLVMSVVRIACVRCLFSNPMQAWSLIDWRPIL